MEKKSGVIGVKLLLTLYIPQLPCIHSLCSVFVDAPSPEISAVSLFKYDVSSTLFKSTSQAPSGWMGSLDAQSFSEFSRDE